MHLKKLRYETINLRYNYQRCNNIYLSRNALSCLQLQRLSTEFDCQLLQTTRSDKMYIYI